MLPLPGKRSDVRHASGVQGRKAVVIMMKSDDIRNSHPHQRVELYARQPTWLRSGAFDYGLRLGILFLIFDFFGRLPEEHRTACQSWS